jgi:hypothetical protein
VFHIMFLDHHSSSEAIFLFNITDQFHPLESTPFVKFVCNARKYSPALGN